MRSAFDFALELVKEGKSVVPVNREKKALVKWAEYQTRVPSENEINDWRKNFADANIAVVTGRVSGVIVIDCDSDEAAKRFIESFPEANETLQVKTGRGRHFYFAYEECVRNDAGKRLGDGIDIRGEGGYVLVPPSVHANGSIYTYLNQEKPITIPAKLREILIQHFDAQSRANRPEGPADTYSRIPVGIRNQTLTQVGGFLRRLNLEQNGICEALLVLNKTCCQEPLPENDVRRIADSIARYPAGNEVNSSEHPWAKIKAAPEFIAEEIQSFAGLARDLLAPGSITMIVAPRGLGKTMVAHALAVALASGGAFRGELVPKTGVLLLDRDNGPGLIQQRLRAWGASNAEQLHVLTRKDVPDLRNKKAWECFPFEKYGVVIIDAVGSFTEGITEKEGKQTTEVLATVLDLARRGVAVLLLQNTTKDGANLRGRGEWADRSDIIYEVRDATGFVPPARAAWWEKLPESGEAHWAERATRRRGRTDYRLAFIPSKFRVAQEPEPFCLEINLPKDEPWTVNDVTNQLVKAGEDAKAEAKKEEREKIDAATRALLGEIATRQHDGNPMLKSAAEEFLLSQGLGQTPARALIKANTGTLWSEQRQPGGRGRGNPIALIPRGGDLNSTTTTELQRNGVTSLTDTETGNETNLVDPPRQSKNSSIPSDSEGISDTTSTPLLPSESGKRPARYGVTTPSQRSPSSRTRSDAKTDEPWEEEL